jgi:hypothetical protein
METPVKWAKLGFFIRSVFISIIAAVIIWSVLDVGHGVLVPFFFVVMYIRYTNRQVKELHELAEINHEILVFLASKDPNFDPDDFIGTDEDDDDA